MRTEFLRDYLALGGMESKCMIKDSMAANRKDLDHVNW